MPPPRHPFSHPTRAVPCHHLTAAAGCPARGQPWRGHSWPGWLQPPPGILGQLGRRLLPRDSSLAWHGSAEAPQRWQPRAPWGPTNQTPPPGVRAAASPPSSTRSDGPEDSLIIALLNPHGQFGSISINNVESFYLLTGCKSIRENNVKSGAAE